MVVADKTMLCTTFTLFDFYYNVFFSACCICFISFFLIIKVEYVCIVNIIIITNWLC